MAELRQWQPGLFDRARHVVTDWLGGDRSASYQADKWLGTSENAPVIGDLLTAAQAKDAYDQGSYGTAGLYGAAAMLGVVPVVGDAAAQGIKKGIKAYHGTPHNFDKFDMSKMGTGEGAQVYSPGLYFAQNEKIAKWYRDQLSKRNDNPPMVFEIPSKAGMSVSRPVYSKSDVLFASHELGQASGLNGLVLRPYLEKAWDSKKLPTKEEAVEAAWDDIKGVFRPEELTAEKVAASKARIAAEVDKVDEWANKYGLMFPEPKKGHMYEVNINADPEDFIDWDVPFNQQSPKVQESLRPFATEAMQSAIKAREETLASLRPVPGGKFAAGKTGMRKLTSAQVEDMRNSLDLETEINKLTGQALVTRALNKLGAVQQGDKAEELRQFMTERGIAGVKYNDAGSRYASDIEEKTKNFVVYDDKLISILRKYGIIPVGMSAAMLNQYVQENPEYGDQLNTFMRKEGVI